MKDEVNDPSQTRSSNNLETSQEQRSLTLSPLQVKHTLMSSLFDAEQQPTDDKHARNIDRGIPLYQALRRMKESLETIAHASPQQLKDILGDLASDQSPTTQKVLRLEQVLSHSVDPLGWLCAQNQRQLFGRDALFYIQSTIETAVFGAAWTWEQPTRNSPDFWNVMASLPSESYLYGGERFDSEQLPPQREDWKDFGATWWVLPAVELREEPVEVVVGADTSDGATTTVLPKQTTLAIHLVVNPYENGAASSWSEAAQQSLQILNRLDDGVTDAQVPATTLPPVLMRESVYHGPNGEEVDGQDLYERGVTAALEAFDNQKNETDGLKKVVLARRMDLQFQAQLSALDILRKWKYNEGIHEGGNMFYMRPQSSEEEFFGCTPERLFTIQKNSNVVLSEALAGTRPRGTTQAADKALLQDLFGSLKDRNENAITAKFIQNAFAELGQLGLVETTETLAPPKVEEGDDNPLLEDEQPPAQVDNNNQTLATSTSTSSGFFVRRLRHLQHICQRFSAKLSSTESTYQTVAVVQQLLSNLHPTPAVNGFPAAPAMEFIREHESIGFDRGFYAGPIGYMGQNAADILVAIRSGLVSQQPGGAGPGEMMYDDDPSLASNTKVSVYAGAGLVPGSTVQGEWAETSYKLGVVSSLFPQSPITLQSAPTPNVAWASAFVEELIRNGITQFYVCPGSRSTPLVVAIAKAARSNVGVVSAVSVHDERGAGFRAVGYGRGANRPAAIVTSSGTAIANLYPAIVEAGMDGVPMLILTADRPYENRDTGANQAIDQVKAFSSSYIRWFRDILPPHDDVPVSVALADAGHGVTMARNQRGPVHLNIQFRENLAPDGGPIRSDNRADSNTQFNGIRFTDVPGFSRWSKSGDRWQKSYAMAGGDFGMGGTQHAAVVDIARLIMESKRGIIVVGNIRRPTDENDMEALGTSSQVISNFAEAIGFPIIAGTQNTHLRFSSAAVIPFAEHILKNPTVAENIKPDLIIQIGAPLVSTEAPSMITKALKNDDSSVHHVLLHPHHDTERADPGFTVSRKIATEISPFLKALTSHLDASNLCRMGCSSRLAPLVLLGRQLQKEIPNIINEASETLAKSDPEITLTEPQVTLALSMMMSNSANDQSIFLSNSMPIRDAEFFLYPTSKTTSGQRGVFSVGSNRGASGIDGIISSATGFAEATGTATTLLIGDLSALHDINSLHALTSGTTSSKKPVTTIMVNNDGGGIFSFLPIAQHGADVAFEDFFGTPTNTFSYQQGAEAFGMPSRQASRFDSFCQAYVEALRSDKSSLLEAKVVGREQNVAVHREITQRINAFIDNFLGEDKVTLEKDPLPIKLYNAPPELSQPKDDNETKETLVLLHGWMGNKSEWDGAGESLARSLGHKWNVVSIDLPGHGASPMLLSSDQKSVRSSLNINSRSGVKPLSIDEMAKSVLLSLSRDHGVAEISALAGYSLGGRVSLAMKRICSLSAANEIPTLVKDSTKLVLLSSYPGQLLQADGSFNPETAADDALRLSKDDSLSKEIKAACDRACLLPPASNEEASLWSGFLWKWYGMPLWGDLSTSGSQFSKMIEKRMSALSHRGRDLAEVLRQSSPPRNSREDWRGAVAENTLFLAGSRDSKYTEAGKLWNKQGVKFVKLPECGHALLVEAPHEVSEEIANFVLSRSTRGVETTSRATEDISTKAETGASTLSNTKLEEPISVSNQTGTIGSIDYDPFVIAVMDQNRQQRGVIGIGWGEKAKKSNQMTNRSGFILQIVNEDGTKVGVGEVSPLPGLHTETLAEAEEQLVVLQNHFKADKSTYEFPVVETLALDGGLNQHLNNLAQEVGLPEIFPSVRSGFEMALLSLASQIMQRPIYQALIDFAPKHSHPLRPSAFLPVNGLITRGSASWDSAKSKESKSFPSLKVKVGHQDIMEDAQSVSQTLQQSDGVIRADANRAWDDDNAIQFATALEGTDIRAAERLEFVEEPLQRQGSDGWSLEKQVYALERWYRHTNIAYGLDESLADLAACHNYEWSSIQDELLSSFGEHSRGCSAFVLKPALLGVELSLRIARLARKELNIGVTFSSSFDSGVGLAYAAVLASLADASGDTKKLAHGVGTFEMLESDTLSPSFGSYVNDRGLLNVLSLSRALNGLGLDELRDSHVFFDLPDDIAPTVLGLDLDQQEESGMPDENEYEASTTTSSSGREITLVVSLPLPFSADIGCARFTDLPQQSRWSPWIRSVRYLDDGRETEWTLNVRGAQFKWRAVSSPLESPLKGIQWESVSGLKNKGLVEFVETGRDSSLMKVRMSIMTPRILASIFQSTSIFVEDFLRNKLLKWSLEMFRDVVKGDLALERGDVELGDALFGSVEGKATAIEAALSPPNLFGTDVETKDSN